jgi:N-acetylneuraminate synthase
MTGLNFTWAGKSWIIGLGAPTFTIAEIGINHNGDLDVAKRLILSAKEAGFDSVKFQKRNPDVSTPENQKHVLRETPWGEMTYLDYKKKIEFGDSEYSEIARYCSELGIVWFASPWDPDSVDFLEEQAVPLYKVASASVTDLDLLAKIRKSGKPVILSTGMSTLEEIRVAIEALEGCEIVLMQATSSYPMKNDEANLRAMATLEHTFGKPVGYSGHEVGIQISIAAVALGAVAVERHVTLDRAMWGTDQSASLEPAGMQKLIRDIRIVESSLGDGIKRIFDSELVPMGKLRRIKSSSNGA